MCLQIIRQFFHTVMEKTEQLYSPVQNNDWETESWEWGEESEKIPSADIEMQQSVSLDKDQEDEGIHVAESKVTVQAAKESKSDSVDEPEDENLDNQDLLDLQPAVEKPVVEKKSIAQNYPKITTPPSIPFEQPVDTPKLQIDALPVKTLPKQSQPETDYLDRLNEESENDTGISDRVKEQRKMFEDFGMAAEVIPKKKIEKPKHEEIIPTYSSDAFTAEDAALDDVGGAWGDDDEDLF